MSARSTVRDAVEVVITVPEELGAAFASRLGVRTTVGVLTKLLANTRDTVVIGAPFIQGSQGLHSGAVGIALMAALHRGVRVDIVSTGSGLREIAHREIANVPSARFRMWQPQANVRDDRTLGSHAKYCICDNTHAYVGSANMTQNGIGGNLEMGVMLHGAAARQIAAIHKGLVDSGFLVEGTPD